MKKKREQFSWGFYLQNGNSFTEKGENDEMEEREKQMRIYFMKVFQNLGSKWETFSRGFV